MTAELTRVPSTRFPPTDDLTADAPPEARGLARDEVRLLVAARRGGEAAVEHASFRSFPEHVRPGDVLVVNNSATVNGEADGTVTGRGRVVVHVGGELDDGSWVVELRTPPDASEPILDAMAGDVIDLPAGGRRRRRVTLRIQLVEPYPEPGSSPTGQGNRLWRAVARGETSLSDHLRSAGRPIAYGYLRGRYPLEAYQTAFGLVPGSAEMASAARPFTPALVTRLVASGVHIVTVTLHTGLSSQESREAPQPERFAVSASTAAVVNAARGAGGRVIAVGTTATRAIESATDVDGAVHAAAGWTDLVVSPDRPARVVTGLVTGWHNPDASHLLLVESVAGVELTQRAYDAALARHYAWHEFGDSALLLP
ncbi:S-adenosylmethionine:tRNA ribosyltransferase-isomerase [Intrasporangium sp.]|uniref:S-adenosylmethionine:tRNA ribosyltransferase-isomerase n=1 Tax=Intrasporangium sp. TaxID=1925024 RepID=UPI00293B0248|nr:S-adenosylmethionine:tRNA ribosyltransferase-isomerase [Intrasporangium sp.]MDV3222936.1 S-adenosylmethionine:tRNA ribosyltransferase-isomerase [Intrasporangium sp.]